MHQQGAQAISAKVGLDEHSLQCILDRPLDEELRRTADPTRLADELQRKTCRNAATCVINGWPTRYILQIHRILCSLRSKQRLKVMSGEKLLHLQVLMVVEHRYFCFITWSCSRSSQLNN